MFTKSKAVCCQCGQIEILNTISYFDKNATSIRTRCHRTYGNVFARSRSPYVPRQWNPLCAHSVSTFLYGRFVFNFINFAAPFAPATALRTTNGKIRRITLYVRACTGSSASSRTVDYDGYDVDGESGARAGRGGVRARGPGAHYTDMLLAPGDYPLFSLSSPPVPLRSAVPRRGHRIPSPPPPPS